MGKTVNFFFSLPHAIRFRGGKIRNDVGHEEVTNRQTSLRYSHMVRVTLPTPRRV